MDDTTYATRLNTDSGSSIVHDGLGDDGLRDCQALAQRITETKQGVATVGILTFQPLTKSEQKEIVKSKKDNSNRTPRAGNVHKLV